MNQAINQQKSPQEERRDSLAAQVYDLMYAYAQTLDDTNPIVVKQCTVRSLNGVGLNGFFNWLSIQEQEGRMEVMLKAFNP